MRVGTSELATVSTGFSAALGALATIDRSGREEPPPRQRGRRTAVRTPFAVALDTTGLPQTRIARLLDVSPRHVRRWRQGVRSVPRAAGLLVNLLVAGVISIDQAEAAVPAPTRMNGSAKPGLPAPPLIEPTPAPACTLTTADRIVALEPDTCRYPVGDPKQTGFRFCSKPAAAAQPYCADHMRAAYLPAAPRR